MRMHEHHLHAPPIAVGRAAGLAASVTLFLALLAASAARAEAVGSPDAARVLDRYVEVTGGKAAHDAVRSSITQMTLTLPAQEMSFVVTIYAARPNLVYMVLDSPQLGKSENGVNGEIAWERSAMTGPRLREGAEKANALRDATFDAMASWREVFAEVEMAGEETLDGRPCDKVVLTPEAGKPRTAYFDRESGLLRRLDFTTESPAGAIRAQMRMDDYRKVGRILVAHRSEITALSQKRVMTVNSIQQNVDLPADRFEPPAEIQKLLQARK